MGLRNGSRGSIDGTGGDSCSLRVERLVSHTPGSGKSVTRVQGSEVNDTDGAGVGDEDRSFKAQVLCL